MYICKECGEEVKLNFSGTIDNAEVSIDKNCVGIVIDEDIEMSWWHYKCSKCGVHNKDIHKIAIWKD